MATSIVQTRLQQEAHQGFSNGRLRALAEKIRQNIAKNSTAKNGELVDRLDAVHLLVALKQVFAHRHPHIIWEADSPDFLSDIIGEMDEVAEFDSCDDSNFLAVSIGKGLTTAMGLVDAFRRTKNGDWVIAVLDYSSLPQDKTSRIARHLARLSSPLLLVVREPIQLPSSIAAPHIDGKNALGRSRRKWADSSTTEYGLRSFGHADLNNVDSLTKRLIQVNRFGGPSLIRVQRPQRSQMVAANTAIEQHRHQPDSRLADKDAPNKTDKPSVTAVIHEELARLAKGDKRFVALQFSKDDIASTHGNGNGTSTDPAGIRTRAAQKLIWASGLAKGGCHPCLVLPREIYGRIHSQLVRDFCAPKLPVTIIIDADSTDLSGNGRALKNFGQSPYEQFRQLPNTLLMMPSNAENLRDELLLAAEKNAPAAILLPGRDEAFTQQVERQIDSGDVAEARLLTKGSDILLLAAGDAVKHAVAASRCLEDTGLSTSVVDLRFLRPLDCESIRSQSQATRMTAVLELTPKQRGLAGDVITEIASAGLHAPIHVVAVDNANVPSVGAHIAEQLQHLVERSEQSAESLQDTAVASETTLISSSADEVDLSENCLVVEREAISQRQLTPAVEEWFATYFRVGHRPEYVWQWCVHGADLTTLPGVLTDLRPHVCDTKVLSIMLCVLLDDVADEQGQEQFLESLLKVVADPNDHSMQPNSSEEEQYVAVTRKLATLYHNRIKEYPCYEIFKDLLHYDQLQYFNTMRFSNLLNRQLFLLNSAEHDLYLPHAMHMMSFSTLDLMCAPDFQCHELGRIREVIWYVACMGRIGNLLSTWRREIPQHDFTSGVFARAVMKGDITIDQLIEGDEQGIEDAICKGRHEEYFLKRWHHFRECLHERAHKIQSFDMQTFLEGQDRFFRMHLACRGMI